VLIDLFLIFGISYLLGAIPTGYWLGLLYGKNLLEEGSKSTGATNVMRLIGKWQAALVLLLDALKGWLPVYFFKDNVSFYNPWFYLVLSTIPIIAHSKSIYIGFKGGKSSATGLGVLIALNPFAGLITMFIWLTTVYLSKYSSLGSIVCIPLVPLWLYLFKEALPVICFGILAFVYIVLIKHRSNIKRLINGEEPKIIIKDSKTKS
jgi:acyl phosphate:glycerol-3-phosphate acyltransferase